MENAKNILKLNKELLDFVEKEIKPKIKNLDSSLQDVTVFLLAKSTKSFRALNILCEKGFGEDAAIIARSILENLITLSYINKENSEERAELFSGYAAINREEKIKELKEDKEDIDLLSEIEIKEKENKDDGIDVVKDRIEKIRNKECQRIKNNSEYKTVKYSWSCLSIKDMAKETGLYKIYYNQIYWLICQFSHPDSRSSKSYMYKNKRGVMIINDFPNNLWVEESLVLGIDCYIRMLGIFSDVFNIDCEDKIKYFIKCLNNSFTNN